LDWGSSGYTRLDRVHLTYMEYGLEHGIQAAELK
jgi:hypothetical protein